MKIIETYNLAIGYKSKKKVLQTGPIINFNASIGEFIAVIGPNGIGKSTLLRTLARIQTPLSGRLTISNNEQENIKRNEYARLISFVSTEFLKISNLSVYQLVALGRFPYTNWLGTLTGNDKSIIDEALQLTGICTLASKPVNELSDGERQRAIIARALAQDTPIILLDEPTAYLDLINKHDIIHLLSDFAHSKNKIIIFSTHDLNIAISESDKIWLLNRDEAKQGAPEDLIFNNSFSEMIGNKLEFDWRSGAFKQIKKSYKTIALNGKAGLLYELTVKALGRIGFSTNDNAQQCIFIVDGNDKYNFVLNELTGEKEFDSIYGLCNYLRNTI